MADLPDRAPETSAGHEEPVMIFQAASYEEAEVICATLRAEGIMAEMLLASINPVLGAVDALDRDTSGLGIWVRAADAEIARQILSAAPPSEEELAREASEDF